MPEAAAAARWPAARCHLLECSGQEGLARVPQDSDASAPGAGAEPCGALVPLAPPPPCEGGTLPSRRANKTGPFRPHPPGGRDEHVPSRWDQTGATLRTV